MAVEPGGNKNQVRLVLFQSWQPVRFDSLPKGIASCAGRQRRVHQIRSNNIVQAVRVIRVLETRANQNRRIILKDVYSAVAVVYVKIKDRNTFYAWLSERVQRTNCHTV